jgi:putative ABC transport system permease protein
MIRRARGWLARLGGLVTRGRREEDFDAELESHIQLHADDFMRRGVPPGEARRLAVLSLGGVVRAREQYRDQGSVPAIETLVREMRFAARALRQRPRFALPAIVVLAVGIGANTAIFSVVHAVLLRPLPYADPDRLVQVWHVPPPASFPGMNRFAVSPANFYDWQRQNQVFERMSLVGYRSYNTSGPEPETLAAAGVSANYFDVLGVQPARGRSFLPEEEAPGRGQVVILSDALWTRRFGADPAIVGRTLLLGGQPFTVVGVMGPSFRYPDFAELWTPVALTAEARAVRDNHNYRVIARLRPDVTVARAQADMSAISDRLARQYPTDDQGWGAVVIRLHEGLVEDVRPALLVLFGAVGFVLLIACANAANLVLARTLARRKEIALRLAIGASRGRVVREVLCETLLIGLAGGVLSLAVAHWGLQLIVAYFGDSLPKAIVISPNGTVLAFTMGLAIASGVAAGLAGAWRSSQTNLNDALRQGLGRTGSDASGASARAALVTAEVALSIVLLVGAGLMSRSLWLLYHMDPGIDPTHVVTMSVQLPQARYAESAHQVRFFQRALERIRALPGVDSAGATSTLPLDSNGSGWPVAPEGAPAVILAEQPHVQSVVIAPGFLRSLRVPLVRGRDVLDSDTIDGRRVVLVSEAMARRFWPGSDPIGRRCTTVFLPGIRLEIVGVVRDVKLEGLDLARPVQAMYLPLAQVPTGEMSLTVRGRISSGSLVNAATAAVHAIDPEQPVASVRTMDDIVGASLGQKRFTMMLMTSFAALALLLAGVGIYSVLAYAVRQRLREIGIRLALGARTSEVLRLVLVRGMAPTLAGVALGIAGALALSGIASRFVFGVSAADPATLAAVTALVLTVGLLASLVPALRASRVDPIRTLRDE